MDLPPSINFASCSNSSIVVFSVPFRFLMYVARVLLTQQHVRFGFKSSPDEKNDDIEYARYFLKRKIIIEFSPTLLEARAHLVT